MKAILAATAEFLAETQVWLPQTQSLLADKRPCRSTGMEVFLLFKHKYNPPSILKYH